METAELTNILTGEKVTVYATVDHPSSSYGQPVWVDSSGKSYGKVGKQSYKYDVKIIKKD